MVPSDNVGEFLGMKSYLGEKGIILTAESFHSPQSNALASRKSRTLMDKVRAMLKDTSMPWRYWGEALNHDATLHKCSVSSAIVDITPQQSLSRSPPNNFRFRIFGCAVYVHMDKEVRNAKWANHAQIGVQYTWAP